MARSRHDGGVRTVTSHRAAGLDAVLPWHGSTAADEVDQGPQVRRGGWRARRPAHRSRTTSAVVTSMVRLAAVPLCLGAVLAPPWWRGLRSPTDAPGLGALALVLPIATLVAWHALRRPPTGPRIHDRQLDVVLGVLAAIAAVEFVLLARDRAGGFHGVAAMVLVSVAVIVIGWGTRALWHVRWALLFLFLAWPAPWVAAVDAVWPSVRSVALTMASVLSADDVDVATTDGVLRAELPSGGVTLDPAAGGGVLLLGLVGLLVGIGWALCCSRGWRRVGVLATCLLVGIVAALAGWAVTVLRLTAGEPAAAAQWTSGAVQRWALLVLLVVGGLVIGARTWTNRRRSDPDTVAARLAAAVPRVRSSTALLAALGLAFSLLWSR